MISVPNHQHHNNTDKLSHSLSLSLFLSLSRFLSLSLYIYICVCVCVCERERERERERGGGENLVDRFLQKLHSFFLRVFSTSTIERQGIINLNNYNSGSYVSVVLRNSEVAIP